MKVKLFFIVTFLLLVIALTASLRYGAVSNSWQDVADTLMGFDEDNQIHLMIHSLRMPRTIGAVAVGASFATAGAIMQGITRNPIADSGLLGINAGAGLGLAIVFSIFAHPSPLMAITASFSGAVIAVVLIYFISMKVSFGLNPIRVVLLGAAISAFFSALSQALSLVFNLSQDITFWYVGGTGNVSWDQALMAVPIVSLGIIGACLVCSQVTLLSMGDEVAISLGKEPARIRKICMLLVLLLAGTAVSLVGTISFVGLLIPHAVRYFVGHDYKNVIPASALLGALFFLIADIGARMAAPPIETPVGVVITSIGVPFLLYKIRKEKTI